MKKLNTTEKQLKFSCANCQTTWQLLVIRTDLLTDKNSQCFKNCLDQWQSLLIKYCQEQIILDFANQEQQKDEKSQELDDLLTLIKKENAKK